jgi:acyl-CoA oxidase
MDADDKSYFAVWNDSINAGLAIARLRGERIALERLYIAEKTAQLQPVGSALGLLTSLYGLSLLQRDAGWYLAHQVITAEQLLALPGVADGICEELRTHIPTLLEGFALTPQLLRSPIASEDYVSAFCEHIQVAGA